MKKQILSIFLCILCILSLIGCGKKKNTKSAEIVDNNITSEEESVSDEYFEVRVFNSNYDISGWDSLQSMQPDFDLNSFKIIDVLGVQFKPDDFVLINSTPDNVFDCIFKIFEGSNVSIEDEYTRTLLEKPSVDDLKVSVKNANLLPIWSENDENVPSQAFIRYSIDCSTFLIYYDLIYQNVIKMPDYDFGDGSFGESFGIGDNTQLVGVIAGIKSYDCSSIMGVSFVTDDVIWHPVDTFTVETSYVGSNIAVTDGLN